MNLKYYYKILLTFLISIVYGVNTYACDGMSVNIVSNTYLGNGIYQLTVQFCETPSNGAGTYGVYGIILQLNGGATIVGTSTPSFTSNANGSVINYNQLDGNTAEWGNWDNNPAGPIFIPNGSPSQCVTMVVQTQGQATSVNVFGSSHSSNLGSGFVNITPPGQSSRWTCRVANLPIPPAVCTSNWTPPVLCPNSTTPFDLNTTTSLTGTFSGPGVNSTTGILDPTGLTFPISVTFTVGDAGFNCSTTHSIIATNVSMTVANNQTICEGQSANLTASASTSPPCNYNLQIRDTYGDGWNGGANIAIYINGVLFGTYTVTSANGTNWVNIPIPVNTGDVITMYYTAGSSYNSENRVILQNSTGTTVYTSGNNPPSSSSNWIGSGLTVNCGENTSFNYAWSPSTGLSNANAQNPTASPTSTTTYTVTATNTTNGCTITDQVTVTVNPIITPTFDPIAAVCQNATPPTLPATSTNGITGTWSPATVSTATVGTTTYTFTPDADQCAEPTTLTVTVNEGEAPTFDPIDPICQNASAPALLGTSTNGVAGTWSPATINTGVVGTETYTFTPSSAVCTTPTTIDVTINPLNNPTFDPIPSVCQNAPAPVLPGTSTNGISGTWSGTVSTAAIGDYQFTFTPDGTTACATTATTTVTINPLITPTFDPVVACLDAANPILPTTSLNGITGTWSPATSTSAPGETIHTFTFDAGQCATNGTTTVTVLGAERIAPLGPQCTGTTYNFQALPNPGFAGTMYSWNVTPPTGIGASPTTGNTENFSTVLTNSTTDPINGGGTPYITIEQTYLGVTCITEFNPTINPEITPTFDPIPPVCLDAPAPNLPTTSTNGVTGTWSGSVNTAVEGDQTFTFTPDGTTVCAIPTTITVTVNPLPTINAGTDQTVCIGDEVTLSASGGITYVWDNGITDGAPFTPVADLTYTVTGTDANGCENTDDVNVSVVALPEVNAGADVTICIGESVSIEATGASTYVWDNGATQGGSVSPTVTTTYTVVGTAGSCIDDDEITITVNPLPVVTADGITPICIGETTTLTGGGAVTYVWDNGAVDGVAISPTETTTYTVTGTDANNCENTASIQIVVNPLPTINAGTDQTVCIGDEVTLSASGGVTYVWDNGITDGVPFTPVADLTYTVTGTDANGCVNTDDVNVSVVALPEVNAGADVTICIGESVTLEATGASTYVWDNGATQGGSVSPTVTTTYTVVGTAGSCIDDDEITITVNPLPLVTADGITPICIGETTTLTGGGAVTYVWDNGAVDGVAISPTETTTYTVTGTDANNCENTASIQIVVNPLPTINAGTDQTVCMGDQVVLTGAGGVNYSWNNGVTNGMPFTPATTMTYTVTGTDANGCVNTDDVLVTVVNLPVVNAGPDVSICIGASTTLTATGATTYTWTNGATQGGTISPTQTTTYIVTGVAGSCQSTDEVTITVNPLPTVTAQTPDPICFGQSVTLIGEGATSFVWDNGVINSVPFTPTQTGTYTVVGTDGNGCQNTTSVVVNVNPLPIIDAGPDVTICPGGTFIPNGNGGTSYTWNNGAINGVPMEVFVTITFTVTGTDVFGCQNFDNMTVLILPVPPVNAGQDVIVCEGFPVTLTGSGAPILAWDNDVQDGVPFTPTQSGIYTLMGVDNNGCINSDQVLVTISPTPIVQFSPDVTNGCSPLTVVFTNQTAPGISCVWDFGDGTTGTGCNTVTHTFTGEGCFDVSMTTTSVDGCVGTQTYTDMICLVPNPVAQFTVNPNDMTMINTNATMNNESLNSVSYTWDFGDNSPLSNAVNPSHEFPYIEAGSYVITLIAENEIGCTDTAQQVVTIREDVIFYVPNTFTPDGDAFNQEFKPVFTAGFDPYNYGLYIYNRWGELIFESHNAEIGWNGSYGGVADTVQDGTYVWKIEFKQSMNDKRRMETGHVTLIR